MSPWCVWFTVPSAFPGSFQLWPSVCVACGTWCFGKRCGIALNVGEDDRMNAYGAVVQLCDI